MVSALKSSAQALKAYILQTKSRTINFVKKGTPGQRFAPQQTGNHDSKIGSRLDNGETFVKDGKEYKRYNFQLNKQASNPTLKAEAQKDSHKVWAKVDVELEDNPTYENSKAKVEDAFQNIEDQL